MSDFSSLIDHFSNIKDPRIDRTKRHLLIDIIVIGVVGTICGGDGWEDIQLIAEEKEDWLSTFLELPNGIPSHDTLSRVFSRLKPSVFEACFVCWMKDVATLTKGEIVAIDGKRVRGSYDKSSSKAAIHMVSAWAVENGVVMGQIKVDDKSNEITAIPKLLDTLELTGCIVTIDAMGCQRSIAQKIIENGADYVFGLKGNQGNTLETVKEYFDTTYIDPNQILTTVDNEHGRHETREYFSQSTDFLGDEISWPGIQSVTMVTSTRETGDSISSERRFYISSLKPETENLARAIRGHWGVENSLHWVLDVTFGEDKKRIRKGDSAENSAVLRHIALNLLKGEKTFKASIKKKRLKSCMSNKYLGNVLCQGD